jgi:predicted ATPase
MITRIVASDYLCLRSVGQELSPFQILVGPNGSGKSAFLDVLAFLGTLVSDGVEAAVNERTRNLYDLVWGREHSRFNLAVEAWLPEHYEDLQAFSFESVVRRLEEARLRGHEEDRPGQRIRYEVTIWLDPGTDFPVIEQEHLFHFAVGADPRSGFAIINRQGATLEFRAAADQEFRRVAYGGVHSALGSFEQPAAAWLRQHLSRGIQFVKLSVDELRRPSPPQRGAIRQFRGSDLARAVNQLKENSPNSFDAWLAHLRTALPDLDSVRTVLRGEDRSRYVMARYTNGVEVPSWTLSEGTLRLLALTLLAYIPDFQGVYLIEEPENGVHPTAIETIYQSLSSIYEGQVLVATHSPVWLALAKPEELLCFTKTAQGTEIVRGSEHPALQQWRGEVNLSDLFAAGVLG